MDKKVELQVLNITNSQAQVGAFALLLGEVNGERQLPIIIGPAEAQATALYMKGVKTPRPLTHDLFMTIIGVLGASLLRVLIYKAKDGIFYSYIYLKKDEEIIRIDTRTSDAVGMAIRAECPILIYESILEQECLRISNEERRHPEESDEEAEDEKKRDLPRNVTSMSLEEALDQAIKSDFRSFLGKPFIAVHIFGRRHGNVQMTRPERFLKDCFFDGYKATLVGCNRDFCFIEMSLTVRKSDFVSDTQPQDAGTMLCFLFRKFVVFLYIGSIKYVHNWLVVLIS